jgi:hypothetical protein
MLASWAVLRRDAIALSEHRRPKNSVFIHGAAAYRADVDKSSTYGEE